jgi:hypothetical protein
VTAPGTTLTTPIGVYNEKPPADAPMIQFVNIGDSNAAKFAERVNYYAQVGGRLMGKIERLPVP